MSAQAAQRVKAIVDELLSTRISDLGDRTRTERRLHDLAAAVGEVQAFGQSIQGLLGSFHPAKQGPGRPAKYSAPQVARPSGPPPSGRRRRGPGDFPAKAFILEAVTRAGSVGVRPKDIVAKVVVAAPGRHVRPSALVSTILTRLKRDGKVKSRSGVWKAA